MTRNVNIRSYITIYITILLILLLFQIVPYEMKLAHESSAASIWHQTNWSAPYDYVSKKNLEFFNGKEDIKLPFYDFGMIVTDQGNHRIVMTDMNGSYWHTYGTQGSGVGQFDMPWAVSYNNNNGYIYIGDYFNFRIAKTKIDGSGWTTYGTKGNGSNGTGQFGSSFGIDYDSTTGYIYVGSGNRIIKTMMNGSGWTAFGTLGNGTGEFNQPAGISFDSSTGFIYVADYMNHRIVRTKMDGMGWTTFGKYGSGHGHFNRPSGIHYDSGSGYVYVADAYNHRIVKTKMDGSNWTTYGTYGSGKGQFLGPRGIQYDNKTDYLYITDANHRIIKTKMNGSGWTTYGTCGTSGKGVFKWPSDIALFYDKYFPYGFLESHEFFYGGPSNLITLSWSADTPPNTTIKFQLRTGIDITDLNSKNFVGPNGSTVKYYTKSGKRIWSGHYGDRWVQYKVVLSTQNHSVTPVLKDVKIVYNLLPERPIIISPVNNTITNDNTPTFTWQHVDNDSISQSAYQWQMDNNNDFQSINYDRKMTSSALSSYTLTTPIPDGVWYWRLRTCDSDNGWGSYCIPRKILIDAKTPISEVTLPENDKFYNKLNSIQGKAEDTYLYSAGINKTEITIKRLSDGKYWVGDSWSDIQSWLITSGFERWRYNTDTISWTSCMKYLIQARSTDNATNQESPGAGITFNYDIDAPVSIIESPLNNSCHNKLFRITGSSNDPGGAGVKKVEITIKDMKTSKTWDDIENAWVQDNIWLLTLGNTTWSYDSKNVLWETGNRYLIISRAIDYVDIIENPTDGISFIFDLNRPGAFVIYPDEGAYLNKVGTIFGNATDIGGSGIKSIDITIKHKTDDLYWSTSSNSWVTKKHWLHAEGGEEWTYDASKVHWQSDSRYLIIPKVTDNAGNENEFGLGITFMYDDQPPVISFSINNGADYTNSTSVRLSLDSQDTGSGVVEMAFSNDSNEWTSWEPFVFEKDLTLAPGDSEKIVYFKVRDRANNTAKPVTNTIILDTTPPICSVIINDDEMYTNSKSVALKLTCSDSLSGIKDMSFSPDNLTWIAWEPFYDSKSYSLIGNDGIRYVICRVRDYMGNIGYCSDTIILDTTPPSGLEIAIENSSLKLNQIILLLKLNATDWLSGVDQMSFSTNYKDWTAWEPFINEKFFILPSKNNQKIIFFRVKDRTGNVAVPVGTNIDLTIPIPEGDIPVRDKSPPAFNLWIVLVLIIIIIIFSSIIAYINHRIKSKKKQTAEKEKTEVIGQTIKPQKTLALFTTARQTTPAPSIHQLSGFKTGTTVGVEQHKITQTILPRLESKDESMPQLPPPQKHKLKIKK